MRLHISLTRSLLFALLFVFAAVYGVLFFSLQSRISERTAELNALKAENAALSSRREAFSRELAYVQSDEGVQLYAHLYGYQFPDETCYNAVVSGSD